MGGNGVNSAVNTLIRAHAQLSGNSHIVSRAVILSNITRNTRNGMTQAQALSAVAQSLQQQGANVPANLLPSNVAPKTKTPNMTGASQNWQDFTKMSGQEAIKYLDTLGKVKMPVDLPKSDTQRLLYDLGINDKPQIVSTADFDKTKGDVYYRGVEAFKDTDGKTIIATGMDIANETVMSQYTHIGGGVNGDGFYFSERKSEASSYAGHPTNLTDGAIMRMKIAPNARVITNQKLRNMFYNESSEVQHKFTHLKLTPTPSQPQGWSGGWLSAYAVYKGYDIIHAKDRGHMIVINRGAVIVDQQYYTDRTVK